MRVTKKEQEQLDSILEQMKEIDDSDPMSGHITGDELLMQALRVLGQDELVDAYENLTRWFD